MIRTKIHPTKLFLILLLAFSLTALACRTLSPESSTPQTPAVLNPVSTPVQVMSPLPVAASSEEAQLIDLYTRVNPAVVNISIYITQNDILLPASQGSGFVYDDQGHIITNAHVVHGAEAIDVTFAQGVQRTAQIVGEDLHSDLAVIKIDGLPAGVNPLPLGDMNALRVGQGVVAIGNPFGLEGTLTRGIISALGRTIPALTVFSIPQSIQTDAAINPGNSGGPLLNLQGQVIGVNAQIETDNGVRANSGVGFAIPVSIIQRVVPELIQNGSYSWPWLGVRGRSLNWTLVKAMDLPVETGAYLWEVVDGGPASKAGLRGFTNTVTVDGRTEDIGGDVVTAINGQPVNSFDDLLVYIALNTRPGQQVTLTVLRDGSQQEFTVTLDPRPEN